MMSLPVAILDGRLLPQQLPLALELQLELVLPPLPSPKEMPRAESVL
jgi:hypothetical protein